MERRLQKAKPMPTVAPSTELIHEGKFIAEVQVELIETVGDWSPYLSLDDAERLDKVRLALRAGDLEAASALARVYELTPVTAE